MNIDFSQFFKRYKGIVQQVDDSFLKVATEFPNEVKCKAGCADCCEALFDMPLIEAMNLNKCFNEKITASHKEKLIESANRVDRQSFKERRRLYKIYGQDKKFDILTALAELKIKCPLLDEDKKCILYEDRPITCRLYGIPISVNGKGHTCGISGFQKGGKYYTANMDKLYSLLYNISVEVVEFTKSPHGHLASLLVPVSTALITEFNDEFFNLKDNAEE